ncbi:MULTISPECIES: hypothetical protein [unclassified Saccharibacter]|uniref:hypothetical protein n=1 Tax=unclassified Saccharibacter TaxID=2648722 RepID=UPI001324A5C7|nr:MULTISPECIES: hypothetical protein [unclassified Saccharibacter]MXV36816.1 hypothetical protein [Saccharibacter sp. EH611]MXV58694.1 hypothetical protein [Saccharibacter sp. EH70]MXV66200.1 hypothetical protein [Saccharibacter sp. EH60]
MPASFNPEAMIASELAGSSFQTLKNEHDVHDALQKYAAELEAEAGGYNLQIGQYIALKADFQGFSDLQTLLDLTRSIIYNNQNKEAARSIGVSGKALDSNNSFDIVKSLIAQLPHVLEYATKEHKDVISYLHEKGFRDDLAENINAYHIQLQAQSLAKATPQDRETLTKNLDRDGALYKISPQEAADTRIAKTESDRFNYSLIMEGIKTTHNAQKLFAITAEQFTTKLLQVEDVINYWTNSFGGVGGEISLFDGSLAGAVISNTTGSGLTGLGLGGTRGLGSLMRSKIPSQARNFVRHEPLFTGIGVTSTVGATATLLSSQRSPEPTPSSSNSLTPPTSTNNEHPKDATKNATDTTKAPTPQPTAYTKIINHSPNVTNNLQEHPADATASKSFSHPDRPITHHVSSHHLAHILTTHSTHTHFHTHSHQTHSHRQHSQHTQYHSHQYHYEQNNYFTTPPQVGQDAPISYKQSSLP